jgi:hypothetical protein
MSRTSERRREAEGAGAEPVAGGGGDSVPWRAGPTAQQPSRGSLLHPQEKGPEGGK